jgi:multiple sugar transport system ATP-binding protein
MMYVTHDQTEALTLADRIVCMSMGHVQQIGSPIDLYEKPENTFVATFIGLPPMNMFEGKIENAHFVCDLFDYPLNDKQAAVLKAYDGKSVILGVRPENINREGHVKLNVTNNENLGMNTLVHGKVAGVKNIVCKFAEWCNYKVGDVIEIGFDSEMMHFFELPTKDENGKELPGKAIR